MDSAATEKGSSVQTNAIRRFPEFDGARGLAISLVVLEHTYVPYVVWSWCFVDLFFVLSGFLITSILLATRESDGYFSSFYARRVLRIFPLYLACLFAIFCVGIPIAHYLRLANLVPLSHQLWYWLYMSNWWNGFGHNVYYLSHLWTLAIEEQFYLVWPLVVFLLSRRALAQCCIGIVGACFLVRLVFFFSGANHVLLQRGTIFRMDTLAMGGLIAILATSPRVTEKVRPYFRFAMYLSVVLFTTIAIVWGLAQLSDRMIMAGYSAVVCMAGYFALHVTTNTGSSDYLCRALRFPVLRNIGKYSYGIYILHYPFVVALFILQRRLASRYAVLSGRLGYLATLAVALVGCYAGGRLSYHFLEKPFLRLKDKFRYEPKRAMTEGMQEERNPAGLVVKTEAIPS